jgi:hypothetical protein
MIFSLLKNDKDNQQPSSVSNTVGCYVLQNIKKNRVGSRIYDEPSLSGCGQL